MAIDNNPSGDSQADNKKESTWLIINYIATYILAVVALFGLYLSIKSSAETSTAIKAVMTNLSEFTEPVMSFDSYEWLSDRTNSTTCSYPPTGISVKYINHSNIPLVIKNTSFEVSYDNRISPSIKPTFGPSDRTFTIAPGKTISQIKNQKDFFQNAIRNKRSALQPPFLECKFTADVQNISGTKKYKLTLIHRIGIDCALLTKTHVSSSIKEELIPIKYSLP